MTLACGLKAEGSQDTVEVLLLYWTGPNQFTADRDRGCNEFHENFQLAGRRTPKGNQDFAFLHFSDPNLCILDGSQ